MSDDQTTNYLDEWMEAAQKYSDDAVTAAVAALRKRNVAFPPSVGQLHTEFEKANADLAQAHRGAMPALPAPKDEYSAEHRERMAERWAACRAGILAAKNVNYGLVPRGTRPAKPIVHRVVPPSFREVWERQRARQSRQDF
jgi:hypothetical protein